MKWFNFQAKEEWLKKIKEFAKSKGLTVAALIRLAVNEYMKREG